MKKLLLIISLLVFSQLNAGRGGAIAGGIIGGFALGSIVANASQPRYVYVEPDNRNQQAPLQVVREIHYVNVDDNKSNYPIMRRNNLNNYTDIIRTDGSAK